MILFLCCCECELCGFKIVWMHGNAHQDPKTTPLESVFYECQRGCPVVFRGIDNARIAEGRADGGKTDICTLKFVGYALRLKYVKSICQDDKYIGVFFGIVARITVHSGLEFCGSVFGTMSYDSRQRGRNSKASYSRRHWSIFLPSLSNMNAGCLGASGSISALGGFM